MADGENSRQRERDRDRDRDRDRETERQRERQRDRERLREKPSNTNTCKKTPLLEGFNHYHKESRLIFDRILGSAFDQLAVFTTLNFTAYSLC